MTHTSLPAAHGGDQWQARDRDALATVGVSTEYGRLRRVIMHRPGVEIDGITNPGKVLWDDIVEPTAARQQHDNLTRIYRSFGVDVIELSPGERATPNIYFCRDHFFMTPRGAIIAPNGVGCPCRRRTDFGTRIAAEWGAHRPRRAWRCSI